MTGAFFINIDIVKYKNILKFHIEILTKLQNNLDPFNHGCHAFYLVSWFNVTHSFLSLSASSKTIVQSFYSDRDQQARWL